MARHRSAAARLAAVVAIVVGLAAPVSPVAAQAGDGLDGDTYTSDQYGWSVEFDADVWVAEEIDERNQQGISLITESNEIAANLVVYDDGITSNQECIEDLERILAAGDDIQDAVPAERLDAPRTVPDALSILYTGRIAQEDVELDLVLYFECREVDGATLPVGITALESSYEDNIPVIEELLAAIDTGGSSGGDGPNTQDPDADDDGPSSTDPVTRGGDDPTPEEDDPTPDRDDPTPDRDDPTPDRDDPTPDAEPTEERDPVAAHDADDRLGQRDDGTLGDDAYRSDLGYGLSWDAGAVEGSIGDDAGAGVTLEGIDTSAVVELAAFEDAAIKDCIDAEVARILDSPDYASAARSNGIRPPTSSDDAVGRMLRATEDTTQQARKVIYVECRPLADEGEGGDPVFLVVRAVSDDEDFRESRKLVEALLASITIGDEPAPEPTREPTRRPRSEPTAEPADEPTPRPRRTPTAEPEQPANLGETDIAGGVFVGEQIPFRVEWSPSFWDVTEIDEQGVQGISLSAEAGVFGRIISAATPADFGVEQCFESLIGGWAETTPDLEIIEAPGGRAIAFPSGSIPAYGIGTLTLDDGSTVRLISAAGCLPLDDGAGFLIMEVQTFEPLYAENAAAYDQVLATIQLGGASGGQQGRLAPTGGRASAPSLEAARRQP